MVIDHGQEVPLPEEPTEFSVLEIKRERLGRISVKGRAVAPFLCMILVLVGPSVTVYVSAKAGFPAWAALAVVGVQVVAALVMTVVFTRFTPRQHK